MSRFLLVVSLILFFAVQADAQTTFVRCTASGRPVNTIGRPVQNRVVRGTVIERYTSGGNVSVNNIGKPISNQLPTGTVVKKYTRGGRVIADDVGRPQSSMQYDEYSKAPVYKEVPVSQRKIGSAKPPRVLVYNCGGGLTRYKDGVPVCGNNR